MPEAQTVEVTKDLFQKAFLVYLISSVQKGVWGAVRLQKLAYNFEIRQEVRPFTFIRYKQGPWSPGLDESKDLLIAAQWIQCLPEKSKKGDKPLAVYRALVDEDTKDALEKILSSLPDFLPALQTYIAQHAYRTTDELISDAYNTEAMKNAVMEDTIVEEQLPEAISVRGLTQRDLEDLQLGMDPTFTNTLHYRLREARAHPDYDWRSLLSSL